MKRNNVADEPVEATWEKAAIAHCEARLVPAREFPPPPDLDARAAHLLPTVIARRSEAVVEALAS
ncbi:MAG: hypothetical protein ABR924_10895 [Terracidiphilus sp.]|jgi:hypothetical protein